MSHEVSSHRGAARKGYIHICAAGFCRIYHGPMYNIYYDQLLLLCSRRASISIPAGLIEIFFFFVVFHVDPPPRARFPLLDEVLFFEEIIKTPRFF